MDSETNMQVVISPIEKIYFHQTLKKMLQLGSISEQEFKTSMQNIGLNRLQDEVYVDQSGVIYKMH